MLCQEKAGDSHALTPVVNHACRVAGAGLSGKSCQGTPFGGHHCLVSQPHVAEHARFKGSASQAILFAMASTFPDGWNDATVVLAANDVSAELPDVPLPAIIEAAAFCRRQLPAAAGHGALRRCIRRRALGYGEIAAPSSPPHEMKDGA